MTQSLSNCFWPLGSVGRQAGLWDLHTQNPSGCNLWGLFHLPVGIMLAVVTNICVGPSLIPGILKYWFWDWNLHGKLTQGDTMGKEYFDFLLCFLIICLVWNYALWYVLLHFINKVFSSIVAFSFGAFVWIFKPRSMCFIYFGLVSSSLLKIDTASCLWSW